jgi:co-chaperonin GroES (HSP10)
MIVVTGCRILVDPLKEEEVDEKVKSAKQFGIVLLESDERKQKINMDRGVILQIGPKAEPDYIEGAKVGDTVGFAKFGGKFVTDPETKKELLVLNDEDIICVFKENK